MDILCIEICIFVFLNDPHPPGIPDSSLALALSVLLLVLMRCLVLSRASLALLFLFYVLPLLWFGHLCFIKCTAWMDQSNTYAADKDYR